MEDRGTSDRFNRASEGRQRRDVEVRTGSTLVSGAGVRSPMFAA
jgi:hypothetical protein